MSELLIGVFSSLATLFLKDFWEERHNREKKSLLKKMLEDERFKWRNISTLSAVIGSPEKETQRLLIQIKARGSEKADGKWGLISKHPFPKVQ